MFVLFKKVHEKKNFLLASQKKKLLKISFIFRSLKVKTFSVFINPNWMFKPSFHQLFVYNFLGHMCYQRRQRVSYCYFDGRGSWTHWLGWRFSPSNGWRIYTNYLVNANVQVFLLKFRASQCVKNGSFWDSNFAYSDFT